MNIKLDEIIFEAGTLPLIPLQNATDYQENIPYMVKYVNDTMSAKSSIYSLIGNNPLQIIFDNHQNHASLMSTVFFVQNYEMLARTIPWVYKVYFAHNFSYEYFLIELNTWIDALDKYLRADRIKEIKAVYHWLIKNHKNMIDISKTDFEMKSSVGKHWLELNNKFLTAILEGNHRNCLKIAESFMYKEKDIESFYLNILQPVMYEVGMLWEKGIISVAQEHLSSAIVSRVMATTSILDINMTKIGKKAIITSAPN